jgi:hypothetical protein
VWTRYILLPPIKRRLKYRKQWNLQQAHIRHLT